MHHPPPAPNVRATIWLLSLLLVTCGQSVLAQGTWTTAAPMPTARLLHGAVTGLDGRIYVIGGETMSGYRVPQNANEIYDPATNTWSTGAPMPTARYALGVACGLDGRIYAAGGYSYGSLSLMEIYNPTTNTWTTGPSMPTQRHGVALTTGLDGLIYAIGGDMVGGGANTAVVQVYNPTTDIWSTRAPLPVVRNGHKAVTLPDGRIFVYGGLSAGVGDTSTFLYNPVADNWSSGPATPTVRNLFGACISPDGTAYAFSGWNGDPLNAKCQAYSDGAWSEIPDIPTTRYGTAAAASSDGVIYVIGGSETGDYGVTTNEAYHPEPSPYSLNAVLISSSQARLAWQYSGTTNDGFVIQRKAGSGEYADYATFQGPAVRTFQDNGIVPGTTYTYRVCAYTGTTRSAWSNEASVSSACGNKEYVLDSDTVLLDHLNGTTLAEKVGGTLAYPAGLAGLNQAADFQVNTWSRYAFPGWHSWEADYAPEGKEGTVEFWVCPRQYEVGWMTFNWYSSDTKLESGYVFTLGTDSEGHVRISTWDAINEPRPTTTPFPAGTSVLPKGAWTHVAYTWSPTGSYIFVNGAVDASSPYNYYPALNPTTYAYVNSWGFRDLGLIDELRISKVARTFFSTLPPPFPVPGDIAPVGPSGINTGRTGARYGDGLVNIEDATLALRVFAGLNTVP